MAVTDYASILTEVNSHTDRTYTQAQIDTFIGLFEGDVQIELGPTFQRETSVDVTVTSGVGTLPTGFIRALSLTNGTYGELTMTTREALIAADPTGTSTIPGKWAIQGTSLYVSGAYDDTYTLTYEGSLAPLTSLNATNWLMDKAPQAYFWGVMGQVRAYQKDLTTAIMLDAKAMNTVRKVVEQSTVAQHGRASVRINGATP